MWWPSFLSVLHDLWLFSTMRGLETVVRSPVQTNLTHSARPVINLTSRNSHQQLEADTIYEGNHDVTLAIRAALREYDPHLVQTKILTEKEWLLYFVNIKRPSIPLFALQLTPIGRWHTTLKGQSVISVGIAPYTDALMEWSGGVIDRAAVVLQVTPDEIITIGELSTVQPGLYTRRSLTKAQWLELRPVFTTFV